MYQTVNNGTESPDTLVVDRVVYLRLDVFRHQAGASAGVYHVVLTSEHKSSSKYHLIKCISLLSPCFTFYDFKKKFQLVWGKGLFSLLNWYFYYKKSLCLKSRASQSLAVPAVI